MTAVPPAALPAVVLHDATRGWLFLMATARPIDAGRARDLRTAFGGVAACLVLFTVYADRVA